MCLCVLVCGICVRLCVLGGVCWFLCGFNVVCVGVGMCLCVRGVAGCCVCVLMDVRRTLYVCVCV